MEAQAKAKKDKAAKEYANQTSSSVGGSSARRCPPNAPLARTTSRAATHEECAAIRVRAPTAARPSSCVAGPRPAEPRHKMVQGHLLLPPVALARPRAGFALSARRTTRRMMSPLTRQRTRQRTRPKLRPT
eukprot:6507823-Prymnesium_polylepis.1